MENYEIVQKVCILPVIGFTLVSEATTPTLRPAQKACKTTLLQIYHSGLTEETFATVSFFQTLEPHLGEALRLSVEHAKLC